MYILFMHLDVKSLSSGGVTAIVLCCSAIIVGIMITIIIITLTFRLKKQLQAVQISNNAHNVIHPTSTSNANLRQQTQATFHCDQDDDVSLIIG